MPRSDRSDFPIKPAPALLDDPRFPRLYARALRRYGIPERRGQPVAGLVSGEIAPDSLWCCRSGCQPCAMDFKAAARSVLRGLARPEGRMGLRGLVGRLKG